MKETTKLHEVLAVEADKTAAAKAVIEETSTVFQKGAHFKGSTRTYKPFADTDMDDQTENVELVTTVPAKLDHCLGIVANAINVTATKDVTNQSPETRAEIMIGDTSISEALPATTLLMLESQFKGIQGLFMTIPTLAPGGRWVPDPDKGEHIYRDDNPDDEFKTRKVPRHKVLVDPTKEHRAEIEKWTEDERIGRYSRITWSGMMSPADKSALLERTQNLISAIKQARMRANMAAIVVCNPAERLVAYLLKGDTTH